MGRIIIPAEKQQRLLHDTIRADCPLLLILLYQEAFSALSQSDTLASLGMRQSPRGLSVTEPTFGPSGRQLRLNC